MERYVHAGHDEALVAHARRTVADSAAFLIPYLDEGARLVDVGCGPGSITLDLAEYVGEVVGVDAEGDRLESAEAARRSRGADNASFVLANAYTLPFADASFDVAFAHQVLQHLADPVGGLREAARVVRPGGIVAARDADYGTMVHDPHDPRLDRWLELYHDVAHRLGGEPDAGRALVRWFHAAGLEPIAVSTSTWTYSEAHEVAAWRDLWVSRLLASRLGDEATALGLANRSELEDLAQGWRDWAAAAERPFFAFLHGEVVARKPVPR